MFEIAICALIGGEFELPKGSILVSVVYSLSMTKQIEKPLTLKIQHCVNLKTRAQADCLYFVTTLSHRTLPYQFSLVEGGQFDPGSRYGSINISESCNFLVAIVAKMNKQPHKTQKTNMESTLPSKELSSQSMNELGRVCSKQVTCLLCLGFSSIWRFSIFIVYIYWDDFL